MTNVEARMTNVGNVFVIRISSFDIADALRVWRTARQTSNLQVGVRLLGGVLTIWDVGFGIWDLKRRKQYLQIPNPRS